MEVGFGQIWPDLWKGLTRPWGNGTLLGTARGQRPKDLAWHTAPRPTLALCLPAPHNYQMLKLTLISIHLS